MVCMAKIVHSETAPSEAVRYNLAGVEFTLGKAKTASYETDDPTVIANAQAHPWLKVERTKSDAPAKQPDAVADADVEPAAPVALDAGLDQDKKVETEGVAETRAAEKAADPDKKGSK
jgi:hypothetical protein